MAIFSVTEVDAIGVVEDTNALILPPNAWTEMLNVRLTDGAAERFLGYSSIATPTVAPRWLTAIEKDGTAYWVYFGLDKAYSFDGTTHADITPATDFTGGETDFWTGGALNGVLVANNGEDPPFMWTGAALTSLSWDDVSTFDDKGYKFFSLRPYRNFLVGMGWYNGAAWQPHTVYWSNQADPLTIPADWDYADPANDAGQVTLASTSGYLLDGLALRDGFVIYKEDSLHFMQHVGGKFVMDFKEISSTTGALAKRCVAEFYGQHFVFAGDDFLLHDGQTIRSLGSRRLRRSVFNSIDPTYYTKSFVVKNPVRHEIWACFCETNETVPTRAAVWNWRDDTWTYRDLPSPYFMSLGITFPTSDLDTWEGDDEPWESDTTLWSNRAFNPSARTLLAACANDIHQFDLTTTGNGVAYDSWLIRDGLVIEGLDTVKLVRAIYPKATGAGTISVSVGARLNQNDSTAWEGPYSFVAGQDYKIDVRSTGRVHAIKFAFEAGFEGALHGYDIEYVTVGRR